MSLATKVLDRLKVHQRVDGLLIESTVLHCFVLEQFGSPLIDDVVGCDVDNAN